MVRLSFLPASHFYHIPPSFTWLHSISLFLFNISPHLTPSLLPSFVQNGPYRWNSKCWQSAKTTGGANMGQTTDLNVVAARYNALPQARGSRKCDGFRRDCTKSCVGGPVKRSRRIVIHLRPTRASAVAKPAPRVDQETSTKTAKGQPIPRYAVAEVLLRVLLCEDGQLLTAGCAFEFGAHG